MQEEVEQRTVALAISTAKLTANVLKSALSKYLVYRKQHTKANSEVIPHGKQTVKELVGQNQGVANIEIDNGNIKAFERTARKYGVDFAVMKDKSGDMPKYLVFFKSRDEDALIAAFKEFTAKTVKSKEKPSIMEKLRDSSVIQKAPKPKIKKKELEL